MGAFVLTDAFLYAAGYDWTADSNKITMNVDADALPCTTFRSKWKRVIAGLRSVAAQEEGYWFSAATQSVDTEAFANLGNVDLVYTVGQVEAQPASPVSLIGTEVAYLFKAAPFTYSLGDQVGTVAPFKLSIEGTSAAGAVRGLQIFKKATVAATGQLGATFDTLGFGVGAAQKLYVTFHDFVPGATITVQVQSATDLAFSSPTTRGTIGPITTSSGTWLEIPGTITDRYLRLNVSAITGTHTVAAAMGIR